MEAANIAHLIQTEFINVRKAGARPKQNSFVPNSGVMLRLDVVLKLIAGHDVRHF